MKNSLINLINKYNEPHEGLLIDNKVDVYAQKLLDNAIILTYYDKKLIAFIAFYANDFISKNAFLSLILVDKSLRGKKIANQLLSNSIEILKIKKFKKYNLEVLKINKKAIKLYTGFGFKIVDESEMFYKMSLHL